MSDPRKRSSLKRESKPSLHELSAAVAFKIRAITPPSSQSCGKSQTVIRKSYAQAFGRLYNALAVDYDGTLIPVTDRAAKPSSPIIKTMGNLLDSRIPVVVITGRGQSLLILRSLLSQFNRDSLFLAMHNGSRIVEGFSRRKIIDTSTNLKQTYARLKKDSRVNRRVTGWSMKHYSIQAFARDGSQASMDQLCALIQTILPNGLVARNSGYSVDVFPRRATKDACLEVVSKNVGKDLSFLRIGDQGHEFGNDYELLDSLGGFSVGTLSANPRSCFPVLDESGHRIFGPHGLLHLLSTTFRIS